MRIQDIFALGLGLTPTWKLLSQRLDTSKVTPRTAPGDRGPRGASYPCQICGAACKVHDFQEFT